MSCYLCDKIKDLECYTYREVVNGYKRHDDRTVRICNLCFSLMVKHFYDREMNVVDLFTYNPFKLLYNKIRIISVYIFCNFIFVPIFFASDKYYNKGCVKML